MPGIVKKVKEELSFENVFLTSMKAPGVKIRRDVFLKKELIKYYPETVVTEAIRYNPAKAGISRKNIHKIADSVIGYETKKVTMLSVAASAPGSASPVAAAGAAVADITSYFAHILRVVQKLAYLYGFEEFNLNEDDVDSETMNMLLVFLGVMFGVQGAASALSRLAKIMANHAAKKIAGRALTKGVVYPVIKKVASEIGVRMTKQIFADAVASAIPLAGCIASGAITFFAFMPCCNRLRDSLEKYNLSDPDFYRKEC